MPKHSRFQICSIFCSTLGCPDGRTSERWTDFSLFGHQIVAHVVDGYVGDKCANDVDGDPVPVPHFGCVLSVQQFHGLAERLTKRGVEFIIKPHLRFVGKLNL